MPKHLNFQLRDQELVEVERAMKTDPRGEVRQRATALRLLHQGKGAAEVARLLAVTSASVYAWVERWNTGGMEGLANRPRQAQRRKVTAAYCTALEAALNHAPADFGYPFAVWSLERLRDNLTRQTGVSLSIQWLGVVLEEMGYVYRRPKHDLTHLQNLEAKQQALELLDELKKGRTTTLSSSSLWTKRP